MKEMDKTKASGDPGGRDRLPLHDVKTDCPMVRAKAVESGATEAGSRVPYPTCRDTCKVRGMTPSSRHIACIGRAMVEGWACFTEPKDFDAVVRLGGFILGWPGSRPEGPDKLPGDLRRRLDEMLERWAAAAAADGAGEPAGEEGSPGAGGGLDVPHQDR